MRGGQPIKQLVGFFALSSLQNRNKIDIDKMPSRLSITIVSTRVSLKFLLRWLLHGWTLYRVCLACFLSLSNAVVNGSSWISQLGNDRPLANVAFAEWNDFMMSIRKLCCRRNQSSCYTAVIVCDVIVVQQYQPQPDEGQWCRASRHRFWSTLEQETKPKL